MIKLVVPGILFCLLCLSCEEKKEMTAPDDLIEKNKLISVIIELETLEAYYEQIHKRPVVYKDALDSSCALVLTDYGITKEQLEKSIDYYSFYPDSIFTLYESTLDSINTLVNLNK